MDWDQSVNAEDEIETPGELPDGAQPAASNASEARPCLYLGPAGQRCNRPATDSGFCSRHQREDTAPGPTLVPSRRVAVLMVIVALLWPILADLVRELIRLIR